MNRVTRYIMDKFHIAEDKAEMIRGEIIALYETDLGESIFKYHADNTAHSEKKFDDIYYMKLQQKYDNIINNDTAEQELEAIKEVLHIEF